MFILEIDGQPFDYDPSLGDPSFGFETEVIPWGSGPIISYKPGRTIAIVRNAHRRNADGSITSINAIFESGEYRGDPNTLVFNARHKLGDLDRHWEPVKGPNGEDWFYEMDNSGEEDRNNYFVVGRKR